MNRIVFLGSGGGRRMVAEQSRKTGGLCVEFDDGSEKFSFGVDPGPGALVYAHALGLNPEKWKGLLVSHHHIDHISDANAIIDAINTANPGAKPFLIAEEHCLRQKAKRDPYPYITKYHQKLVKKLFPVKAGDSVSVDGLEIAVTKATHYTHNVGFLLKCRDFVIGYPADGSYYPGQEKHFEGCDVIVLNVPWPKGYDAPKGIHATLDDAIELVRKMESRPRLVILSHLSSVIIRANLFKQERILRDAAGVKVMSATDFMELDLDTMKTRILQSAAKI